MTDIDQKQLGKTLWNIADTLRGSMNADDFRDYMLSSVFGQNECTHKHGLMQQMHPSPEGAR